MSSEDRENGNEAAETAAPATATRIPAAAARGADDFRPSVLIRRRPPGEELQAADMGPANDLSKIRRIKADLADKLKRMGVTHFAQMARWTSSDVRALSAALSLDKRIYQENWIEQAAVLADKSAKHGSAMPAAIALAPAPAPPEQHSPTASGTRADFDFEHAAEANAAAIPALVGMAASAILNRLTAGASCDKAATEPATRPTAITGEQAAERYAAAIAAIAASLPLRAAATSPPEPETVSDDTNGPYETPSADPAADPESSSGTAAAIPVPPIAVADDVKDLTGGDDPTPEVATLTEPIEVPEADFTLIERMPHRVAGRLKDLGLSRFSEIADFDPEDIAALSVDCDLGRQVTDECWVEQAAVLASGQLTKAARRKLDGLEVTPVAQPAPLLPADRELIAALTQVEAEPEPEAAPISVAAVPAEGAARDDVSSGLLPSGGSGPEPLQEPAPVDKPTDFVIGSGLSTAHAKHTVEPRGPLVRPISVSHVPDQPASAIPAISVSVPAAAAGAQGLTSPASVTLAGEDQSEGSGEPAFDSVDPGELEEAEVSIVMRTSAISGVTQTIAADNSDAERYPGSLSRMLAKGDRSGDLDAEAYAAYHKDIDEAAVDIVPRQSRLESSPPAAKTENEPDNDRRRSTDEKTVNRFLNALKGR